MNYADRYDEFERAAEAGDLPRAAELAVEMEESEDSIPDLLAQFEEAVDAGDREKAQSIAEKVRDRYDERRPETRREMARAQAARTDPTLSDADREELGEFLRQTTGASLRRAEFFTRAATYLSEPESTDAEEVQSTAGSLRSTERDREAAAESAGTTAEDATVPASVELVALTAPADPVPPDGSATLTATVANVGDDPAEAVTLTATAEGGSVSVAGAESSGTRAPTVAVTAEADDEAAVVELGSVGADGEATREFELVPGSTGTATATVEVTSENAGGDTAEASVEVEASTEPSVDDYRNAEGVVDTPGLREAITDWAQGDIDTDLLQSVIEAWAAGE